MNRPPKRLLAVSSGGGHWIELARCTEAFKNFDTQYASTTAGLVTPSGGRPVVTITDSSRSNPLRLLRTVADLTRLIFSFRPHVIITTGAAPGLLALLIGKLAGSRTVWIDSIANASCMSLSGRISRYCADECLVQWKHLAVGSRAPRYIGSVL